MKNKFGKFARKLAVATIGTCGIFSTGCDIDYLSAMETMRTGDKSALVSKINGDYNNTHLVAGTSVSRDYNVSSSSIKTLLALGSFNAPKPINFDIGSYKIQYQGKHWDAVNDWHRNLRGYQQVEETPGRYEPIKFGNKPLNIHITDKALKATAAISLAGMLLEGHYTQISDLNKQASECSRYPASSLQQRNCLNKVDKSWWALQGAP